MASCTNCGLQGKGPFCARCGGLVLGAPHQQEQPSTTDVPPPAPGPAPAPEAPDEQGEPAPVPVGPEGPSESTPENRSTSRQPRLVLLGIAGCVVALLVGGVIGWQIGQRPDVSLQGRVAYACALVEHIHTEHGDAHTWKGSPLGNDANPAWIEALSAATLLGALQGVTQLPGYGKELSKGARDVLIGVNRGKPDQLQHGLDTIRAKCADM